MKLNYIKKPFDPRRWRRRCAIIGGIIGGIAGSNRELQEAMGISSSLFTPGILLGAAVGWMLGIEFDEKAVSKSPSKPG